MSSASNSRRAVTEIDFSGSQFSNCKIGNRSIVEDDRGQLRFTTSRDVHVTGIVHPDFLNVRVIHEFLQRP